ncbi:MAG: thiamine biosynthesis lipoprotein [Methylophagaceae bacterium]|jgi:thiamine biosynthesis lipoprotein
MISLRLLLLSLCIIILTACDGESGARQAKFYAFGTEIDVSLFDVSEETAKATVATLEASFSDIDETWHAWRPSTLTQINQAISNNQPITVSQSVSDLILLAKVLAQNSDHLFNPAAGKLFELWGFHQDDWFNSRPPPTQRQIDSWLLKAPTMDAVTIENGTLSSTNSKVKLGFGAFAKGFAVDNAILTLQKHGIKNALVNIGGDLRAIGKHGKRPWVIGIRHPRQDGMLATIAVQGDESVFTSGDYERFFEYRGRRYSHILDPRTGWPADQAISVTVLHDNAMIADAAATALFVAGKDWPRVATSMGIKHAMLVRIDGRVELSPDMLARVTFINHDNPPIIRTLDLP